MSEPRPWKTLPHDEAAAARLSPTCKIPRAIGAILAARGFAEAADAARFLDPRLSDLSEPETLPDMPVAVDRVQAALRADEPIAVFGDYDADGLTAAALTVRSLRSRGGRVSAYIPDRGEGYGLTAQALERCLDRHGPGLIVTVDCGTNSIEAAAVARRRGVDLIVTDHHEPTGPRPDAVAVVNPKRDPNPRTAGLAGVGVAFKFCHAALNATRPTARCARDGDLHRMLDLVALGTVADVMALTGENRILVRHGLDCLNGGGSVGLAAMRSAAGVEDRMDTYHLGFVLGPRLNAPGRMGSAQTAFDLLMTDDAEAAVPLARTLEQANRDRKCAETELLNDALTALQASPDAERAAGLVLAGSGWPVGLLGLVAGRVCSLRRRPTAVIGFDAAGRGRGSCRGVEGIRLTALLDECGDLLESYGGHDMAAGLTVRRCNLEAFRERFAVACERATGGCPCEPEYSVDAWIELGEADNELLAGIHRLSPLGVGNPTPLFAVAGVHMLGPSRVVGRDHLKFTVTAGGRPMDCIGFGMGLRRLPPGPFDLLFQLKENTFGGRRSLQLHVKDFRPMAG